MSMEGGNNTGSEPIQVLKTQDALPKQIANQVHESTRKGLTGVKNAVVAAFMLTSAQGAFGNNDQLNHDLNILDQNGFTPSKIQELLEQGITSMTLEDGREIQFPTNNIAKISLKQGVSSENVQQVTPKYSNVDFSLTGGESNLGGMVSYIGNLAGIRIDGQKATNDQDFQRIAASVGLKVKDNVIVTFSKSKLEDKIAGYEQDSHGISLFMSELSELVKSVRLYAVHDDVNALDSSFNVDNISVNSDSVSVAQSRMVGGSDTRYGLDLTLQPLENLITEFGYGKSSESESFRLGLDKKWNNGTITSVSGTQFQSNNGYESQQLNVGVEKGIKIGKFPMNLGVSASYIESGDDSDEQAMITLSSRGASKASKFERDFRADMKNALGDASRDTTQRRQDLLKEETQQVDVPVFIAAPSISYDEASARVMIAEGICKPEQGSCDFVRYSAKVNGKDVSVDGNAIENVKPGDTVSVVGIYRYTYTNDDTITTELPSRTSADLQRSTEALIPTPAATLSVRVVSEEPEEPDTPDPGPGPGPSEGPTTATTSGPSSIEHGSSASFGISPSDTNGIDSVSYSVSNGDSGTGNSYTAPTNLSTGPYTITWTVTGKKADGSADTPVTFNQSFGVSCGPFEVPDGSGGCV